MLGRAASRLNRDPDRPYHPTSRPPTSPAAKSTLNQSRN
jgi:hypothetical protein